MKHLPATHWQLKAVINNMNKILERDMSELGINDIDNQVAVFNKAFAVGDTVLVERDNGETLETITRSEAWNLSGHSAVVQLKGISGCYAIKRVKPVEEDEYLKDFDQEKEDAQTLKWLNEG